MRCDADIRIDSITKIIRNEYYFKQIRLLINKCLSGTIKKHSLIDELSQKIIVKAKDDKHYFDDYHPYLYASLEECVDIIIKIISDSNDEFKLNYAEDVKKLIEIKLIFQ